MSASAAASWSRRSSHCTTRRTCGRSVREPAQVADRFDADPAARRRQQRPDVLSPGMTADTIDVHGRWLNAQNALDTAVRNFVQADGRQRAALAALVRDPTTREIILLDAEASADGEFKNLVDEAFDWGHRPWGFKADCIAGEDTPVTPEPPVLPQVVDPGACPPSVAGAQVKVDLKFFELGIGCDQVEFSGSTPGAVGGFDKVQVRVTARRRSSSAPAAAPSAPTGSPASRSRPGRTAASTTSPGAPGPASRSARAPEVRPRRLPDRHLARRGDRLHPDRVRALAAIALSGPASEKP